MRDLIRQLIKERTVQSGQAAGKVELRDMDLTKAKAFANATFHKEQGHGVEEEIENFDDHFKVLKRQATKGKTLRKDMPVVEDEQVKELQRRLLRGALDHETPFAPETDPKNPFPEGLTGEQAQMFIMRGFHDKKLKDDVVKSDMVKVEAGTLTPIQKQIYMDKSIGTTAKFGVENSKSFLLSSPIIISSDNHIIDGHHRWSSLVLIDPKAKMKALKIGMPINKLLGLLKAYGDAIGNKRNQ